MNLRNLHQVNNIVILELQDVWNLIDHALSIFMLDHFDAHFISHQRRYPLNVAISQNVMLDYGLDILLNEVKHNLRKAQEVFDFSLEAWLLSLECLMVDCLDPAHYEVERLHKDAEVV